MCVAEHTRGTAVPWRVIQQGHGRPVARRHPCQPRRVGTRVPPARPAWVLGGLGSPRRSWPRRRHPRPRALGESAHTGVRGQACWRSPRQRAGGFAVLPCMGLCSVPAWKGCGQPPCHGRAAGANGAPGTVGVQRGHTWAPGACRRGHVRRTGGSRIRGGAGELLPFPGAPANPGVRGGSGATCARACAHAGHLLKHGEIFFPQPRPVPRVRVHRRRLHARCRGLAAAQRVNNPLLF